MSDPSGNEDAPEGRGHLPLPPLQRPLDFLFITRPALMPPVWTIAICGWARADGLGIIDNWRTLVTGIGGVGEGLFASGSLAASFYWGLMLTCLAGGVYVVNQIADIDSDRRNNKLHFLPRGLIHPTDAVAFAALLDLAALAMALRGGPGVTMLVVVGIVMGLAYSLGGRRAWKNRPWAGLAANALAHGTVVFTIGWLLGAATTPGWRGFFHEFQNPVPLRALIESLPYLFAVGAVYLGTAMADVAGDRTSGKTTLPVRYSPLTAAWLAAVLVMLAIGLAALLGDRPMVVASLFALPAFIVTAAKPTRPGATLAVKVAVIVLTLVAVAYWPPYLVVLIAGFFVTRAYFRWRFGMSYPSFGAGH